MAYIKERGLVPLGIKKTCRKCLHEICISGFVITQTMEVGSLVAYIQRDIAVLGVSFTLIPMAETCKDVFQPYQKFRIFFSHIGFNGKFVNTCLTLP